MIVSFETKAKDFFQKVKISEAEVHTFFFDPEVEKKIKVAKSRVQYQLDKGCPWSLSAYDTHGHPERPQGTFMPITDKTAKILANVVGEYGEKDFTSELTADFTTRNAETIKLVRQHIPGYKVRVPKASWRFVVAVDEDKELEDADKYGIFKLGVKTVKACPHFDWCDYNEYVAVKTYIENTLDDIRGEPSLTTAATMAKRLVDGLRKMDECHNLFGGQNSVLSKYENLISLYDQAYAAGVIGRKLNVQQYLQYLDYNAKWHSSLEIAFGVTDYVAPWDPTGAFATAKGVEIDLDEIEL